MSWASLSHFSEAGQVLGHPSAFPFSSRYVGTAGGREQRSVLGSNVAKARRFEASLLFYLFLKPLSPLNIKYSSAKAAEKPQGTRKTSSDIFLKGPVSLYYIIKLNYI